MTTSTHIGTTRLNETHDARPANPSTFPEATGQTETTAGPGGKVSTPGGKVVHLDDELHARVRQHCREEDVQMKEWVSQVLTAALDAPAEVACEPEPEPERPTVRIPVSKKPLLQCDDELIDEPWSRPPFWAKA